MKIEKINDLQMKFILGKSDLEQRNLDIADLAYGSIKTQELFQDIVETASRDYDFNEDDTPVMIEAVPVSKTSIMIIITKVANPVPYQDGQNKDFQFLKQLKNQEKINTLVSGKAEKNKILKTNIFTEKSALIYSFGCLDDVTNVSYKLKDTSHNSELYKYEGNYILVIYLEKPYLQKRKNVEHVLDEYGKRLYSENEILVYHIKEFSNVIIQKDAIRVLANL